jgi:hypothetical protein
MNTERELTLDELDAVSGGQSPPDPDRIMLGGPDTRFSFAGDGLGASHSLGYKSAASEGWGN